MRRASWIRTCLIGLAVLGAYFGTEGSAQAAGIKITGGGLKPFGDPFYFYILEFYLEDGYQVLATDTITLHSLAGVEYPDSTTGAPGGVPSGPWATTFVNLPSGPIPGYAPPTIVPFADVTFINAGPAIANAGPGDDYLGQFKVLTAISLPELPPSYFVDINWTANIHTIDGDPFTATGTVRLTIVPEPASLILLGAGVGVPLLWTIRRRRKLRPS
ncbi:MAG: PEP-CTERM sorting domain-containing protein [Isosphaeraceae bacterium]